MKQDLRRDLKSATDCAVAIFIGCVSQFAEVTGLTFVLFPELAALTFIVFHQPASKVARAWVLLSVTPLVTAIIGVYLSRSMPFGVVPISLSIGTSVLLIAVLRSPIIPAISAGVLPLSVGITNWAYPASVFLGTAALTLAGFVRR